MTLTKDQEIVARLEKEGIAKGVPPRFLEFYLRIYSIQSTAEKSIDKVEPGIDREVALKRNEKGLPLLSFKELTIDWGLLNETFAQIVTVFSDYSGLFGELPTSLVSAESQPSLPKKVVRAWFAKKELPPELDVKNTNEALILDTIIQAAMKPFLVSQAKVLRNLVVQKNWRRSICPVCGGLPDFSSLDKEEGARWLYCSRCDTRWLYTRVQCPYCATEEPRYLPYFTDDKGIYRLYVCDQCHKYIKALDLRQVTETDVLLPLERIITMDMDSQAREKGYVPGYC